MGVGSGLYMYLRNGARQEVSYELSIGTKIGDLEWPWTAEWPLFCVIFKKFGNFRGILCKSRWQSHNYGQFTITMSSSKRLQRDRATPTV